MKSVKPYSWLIVSMVLITCFAFFQAARGMEPAPDGGKAEKLDVHALEQIVNFANSGDQGASTGVKAPPFTLKSLDGGYYSIGGKRDKPVVLNFWGSWCDACSVEAAVLTKLHAQYKGLIDFYGINVSTEEKPGNIEAFVTQNKLEYPILLDEHKHAADLYELHTLPTMFLIDKDGFIVDTFHLADPLELEQKIEHLAGL